MSVIITLSFGAAEGRTQELKDTLVGILPDTRAFEGCERVELVEYDSEPGRLMLIERWASTEQYDAYKTWRRESGTSVLGSDLIGTEVAASTFTPIA